MTFTVYNQFITPYKVVLMIITGVIFFTQILYTNYYTGPHLHFLLSVPEGTGALANLDAGLAGMLLHIHN